VVLIGPPGAGKGTQARTITLHLAVAHISTGDIFRHNVREGTVLGRQAKSYMDSGELVPDELTMAMVRSRLEEDDAARGFLLDGFPRNLDQAEHLEETLRQAGQSVDLVLEFQVPADEIVRRLAGRRTCGECGRISHLEFSPSRVDGICDPCGGRLHQRDDDREDSIRRRLELYEQQTAPLVGFYDRSGILVRIDASGPAEVVGDLVADALVG
jgi:adenylate kinase